MVLIIRADDDLSKKRKEIYGILLLTDLVVMFGGTLFKIWS
jgi:hypothetical protein